MLQYLISASMSTTLTLMKEKYSRDMCSIQIHCHGVN
ncbi:hypothetical protein SLEP1_g55128 [Rubroshorea leprosula]|uniref:Uncharacterized protein n=1 Tax=Rubroshorea leprosula TaxID=152421 RepID=A0AAV5MFB4_9ROSI|nr:hypothetical protein SLEP1_g55128 [Rubroshorea leprosula]